MRNTGNVEKHMNPRDHYRELTLQLLEAESWGTLSETEEESLRKQMDAVPIHRLLPKDRHRGRAIQRRNHWNEPENAR